MIKKLIFLIILILVNIFIFAHVSEVHVYISDQGVKLIGYNNIFNSTIISTLIEESYKEDYVPDYVYNYNTHLTITSTHFWDEDYNFPWGRGLIFLGIHFPSAISKAWNYWNSCNKCILDIAGEGVKKSIFWLYEKNLIDYKGSIWDSEQNIYLYIVGGYIWRLGRISHLLEDMSVPAHVHNDPHGGTGAGGDDEYEKNWIPKNMINIIMINYIKNTHIMIVLVYGTLIKNYLQDMNIQKQNIGMKKYLKRII